MNLSTRYLAIALMLGGPLTAHGEDSLYLQCNAQAIRLCLDGVEQCQPWLPGDGSTMQMSRVDGNWNRSDSNKTVPMNYRPSQDAALNDSHYLLEWRSADGNSSIIGIDRHTGLAEEYSAVPGSRETIVVRWKCEALSKRF